MALTCCLSLVSIVSLHSFNSFTNLIQVSPPILGSLVHTTHPPHARAHYPSSEMSFLKCQKNLQRGLIWKFPEKVLMVFGQIYFHLVFKSVRHCHICPRSVVHIWWDCGKVNRGQLRHSGEKSTRGRLSVREATSETSATSAQPVRHQQSPQKLNFQHRHHHHSSSRSSLLSEACFIFEQYIY